MKKNVQNKYIYFLFIVLILLTMFFLFKRNNNLEINFVQNNSGYYINVINMKNSVNKHKIYVRNTLRVIIYEKEITKKTNKIELQYPNYGEVYSVTAVSYDKDNKIIETSEKLDFVWDTPTFDKTGKFIINKTSNNKLVINGDIKNNYNVIYKLDGEIIATSNITNNEITYPQKIFDYEKQKITAYLMDEDRILDSKNIYINFSKITQVSITNPINYNEYIVDNMFVKYTGGEGANKYTLTIKEDDIVVKEETNYDITEKQFYVDSSLFKPNRTYKILVQAEYSDYYDLKQINEVGIITRNSDYVPPVFTNRDVHVTSGTEIILGNIIKNVRIIYTVDGTNPSINNGHTYSKPIKIYSNLTVKAIAINNQNISSIVSMFNFKTTRKDIKIFVSPSKQPANIGNRKTTYTNEMEIMNRLADLVIPKLKEKGFIVYRHDINKAIPDWARDAKRLNVDFYLALHSNGSVNHDQSGVKPYIDYETSPSYSLANSIQNELMKIYPYKLNPNNGITYAKNSLGEVRTSMVPFSILMETGYHDDYYDAMWIMSSLEEIADSMVNGISDYYGY